MTLDEFYRKHMIVDWESEEPMIVNLTVLNAKPGSECMRMCGLFNVAPTSLMIPWGGSSSILDDQEYVNFVADEDGNGEAYIGSGLTNASAPNKVLYYPEIEPILDAIFRDYPEFITRMPGGPSKDAESSDALYRLLGMEVKDG